jgi:gliding motility-associated-like protein
LVFIGKPSNILSSLAPLARYTWFKDGVNMNVPDTTSQLSVSTAAQYQLLYGVGGCIARDTSNLVINPLPVLNVADIIFCFDNGAFTNLDAGTGHASYKWYSLATPDSLLSHTDRLNRIFTIYAPGRYYINVTNNFGCETNGSILATSICKPDLNPPTGFFPDLTKSGTDCDPGDTRCHDLTFRPYGNFKHAVNIQFTVFNRWGEIIYYTDDASKGWDGSYRGELMPTGTYPWTLYYEGASEEFRGPYRKSGSVTIIK